MDSVFHFSQLDSTNLLLKQWMASKNDAKEEETPANFTIVYADFQTAGRGRQSNGWFSESGKNLLMSVLIYPHLPVEAQFHVSMQTALALSDYLRQNVGLSAVSVKWPNDIYVGDKKIAGILIEHAIRARMISHSIIGIGLNLNQEQFPDNLPNPTSVWLECGKQTAIEESALAIRSCLQRRMTTDAETNRKDYLEQLYLRDRTARFRVKETGESFEGIIRGIDRFGRIIISRDQSDQCFELNEIALARPIMTP